MKADYKNWVPKGMVMGALAVTSNYVYHNIPSKDRQEILLETLRTLKKGGTYTACRVYQTFGFMRWACMS